MNDNKIYFDGITSESTYTGGVASFVFFACQLACVVFWARASCQHCIVSVFVINLTRAAHLFSHSILDKVNDNKKQMVTKDTRTKN